MCKKKKTKKKPNVYVDIYLNTVESCIKIWAGKYV